MNKIRFPNGSAIKFASMKNPRDYQKQLIGNTLKDPMYTVNKPEPQWRFLLRFSRAADLRIMRDYNNIGWYSFAFGIYFSEMEEGVQWGKIRHGFAFCFYFWLPIYW